MSGTMNFSAEISKVGFGFEGPHLVAASAGTGKTYSIQNVCARLVAERGIEISKLLVVTFTEAATKELRDRVRKVLKNFRAYLQNGLCAESERERLESLKRCAVDSGVSVSEAIDRLSCALSEFDGAAIHTIHGLCSQVLTKHAFETAAPFDAELAEENNATIARLVRDWWRKTTEDNRTRYDVATLISYASEFSKRPEADIAAEDEIHKSMMEVARDLAKKYHAARPERATRTFDELLLSVRDALHAPRGDVLAAELRGDFKAVVVDEFQDTDPVQYEIFRCAFLDVPSGETKPILFFVGDPKQAIYSFRGGDIYMYGATARRKDMRDNAFRLEKNFRSTPRLMDAVNLIFRDFENDDHSIDFTFGDCTIDYPSDIAADDKVQALKIDGADDPHPFRVYTAANSDAVVKCVADTALNLLRTHEDLVPRDIAILVSSNSKARQVRDVLRQCRLPVVLQRSGNVFGEPIAREFLSVLRAVAGQGGDCMVRTALATRYFDFTLEQLCDLDNQDTFADMISEMRHVGRIWRVAGFEKSMAKLEGIGRCRFRERFAAMDDGERLLADALQLVDLCVQQVRRIGPSPESLITWVFERIDRATPKSGSSEGEESRSDEYSRELESDCESIRVMTIHVSKGLEFPVTIVPLPGALNGGNPYIPSAPYSFHQSVGDAFHQALSDEAGSNWKNETKDERTRLLYVALTRATKRTVVVKPQIVDPLWPIGWLLGNAGRNWPRFQREHPGVENPILEEDWVEPAKVIGQYEPPPQAVEVERSVPEFPYIDLSPVKGSYSSLAPGKAGKGVRDDDGEDVGGMDGEKESPILALPAGAKVGTCWHEILERIDFKADDAIDGVVENTLSVHGLMKGDPAIAAANAQTVAAMIRANLDYVLIAPDGEKFTLRDIEKKDRISEWEFDFSAADAADRTPVLARLIGRHWHVDPGREIFLEAIRNWDRFIPKGSFVGFLDLVFRHNGYYYIVDWKSNAINRRSADFSATGVAREMAAHGYFFQYLLYSVVLHRFLKETLGKNYSWERHFGGIRYYFLRGVAIGSKDAVFADRPSERMLDELGEALGL